MSFKQKLKRFFKTREATDESVEILKYFILPFSKQFKGRNTTIDDILEAFFNTENRRFAMLVAKRDFKLPGRYHVAPLKTIEGAGPRAVKKGQRMLVRLDRKERTVALETKFAGEYHSYLLKTFEFQTIAEWCDVID